MTRERAQTLDTGSPAIVGCFAPTRALDLLVLPEALEAESSPWPRAMHSFPTTRANAQFPAWDLVDEWGMQSFPASDPPANW